jgi:hypothetical protein
MLTTQRDIEYSAPQYLPADSGFRVQIFADVYCSRICDSYASGDMYLAGLRSGCSVEAK